MARWYNSRQWLAARWALAFALLFSLLLAAAPARANGPAQTLYALTTSNRLLQISGADPCKIDARIRITGLQDEEKLLGIDFRPANGQLYGLGSTSRLYVINPQTGAATQIGAAPFTPALEGSAFGFDFNPVVDRIRVVSNTGQNLRLNPDTGAVVDANLATPGIQPDGRLAYAAGDQNAGRETQVVGAAYTNPDNDPATGTTLYDIDSRRDILAIQNPPNDGVLNTVGSLGVNTSRMVGFDIAASGVAYAALKLEGGDGGCGSSSLVTVNLATGGVNRVGAIGDRDAIRGLAAPTQ